MTKPFLMTVGAETKRMVWIGNHLYLYGADGFRRYVGFVFPDHLFYVASHAGRVNRHSSRFDAMGDVERGAFSS